MIKLKHESEDNNMNISQTERTHLRELAKRQLELSQLPVMEKNKALWYKLNNGETEHPIVTFEFNGPRGEIYPASICQDGLLAGIETQMNMNITDWELLHDDRVIPGYIRINIPNYFTAFNLVASSKGTNYSDGRRSMGWADIHTIEDFERDYHKLQKSVWSVDANMSRTKKICDDVSEIIGDILPVRPQFPSPSFFFLTSVYVSNMGMEKMFLTLYDYPELFHKAQRRQTDEYIEFLKEIEDSNAMLLNNDGTNLNHGSWGYTDDLPSQAYKDGAKISLKDVWGYTNFQETVGMSVDMFDEFFLSYMKEITDHFGLLAYGCCEPVHALWDKCLSRLTNLRKLSVSPWCDEEHIAERIRGKKIVYQRKPLPNLISVDTVFDEEAFRQHIRKTVKAASGCPLEIVFRDVITVLGEPWRMTKAIEIVRQEYDNYWKP